MHSDLFVGIDQGTSSTKVAIIDGAGDLLHEFSLSVPECTHDGRCVEQDPEALLSSVVASFLQVKKWAEEQNHTIRSAGLACQRSGVLAWRDFDGIPLHPMLTWSDTRTYPIIQNFGLGVERITVATGIPTIANFAGGKIAFLQKKFLELSTHVATLDAFLIHRLSGRRIYATEDTMAARSMLYSLEGRNWDAVLCRDFRVDQKRLPRIHPSIAPHTTFEEIPIVGLIGDQQAALIGRVSENTRPLLNLGTIAAIMISTGSKVVRKPGLITSVLASRLIPGGCTREYTFLTEITSAVTGAVLLEPRKREWSKDAQELNDMCQQSYLEHPLGRATAYFVNKRPLLPAWPDGIPNALVCKPDATDSDRARAVVENVGNLIVRMFEELAEKGFIGDKLPNGEYPKIEVDVAGGGSEIDFLLQYIADCTGHTFHRQRAKDAGARGAALCAWMFSNELFDARPLNRDLPLKSFTCEQPERRRRFLMWQRMEQDVLSKNLPPHAVLD